MERVLTRCLLNILITDCGSRIFGLRLWLLVSGFDYFSQIYLDVNLLFFYFRLRTIIRLQRCCRLNRWCFHTNFCLFLIWLARILCCLNYRLLWCSSSRFCLNSCFSWTLTLRTVFFRMKILLRLQCGCFCRCWCSSYWSNSSTTTIASHDSAWNR